MLKDKIDHWILPSLERFKNTGSDDKIKAMRTFLDDVDVLEEDNEMLSSLDIMKVTLREKGFYAIIDINLNLYALQIGQHPFQRLLMFSTVGSDPRMAVRIHWDDVLLISQNPLDVSEEDMFDRYDRQLIQVYHNAPKRVIADEEDPLTLKLSKTLQELSQWQI